jgi:mannose/fructose/N-acetylgalactosamine-specific phosphotransferase system component IIC
LQEYKILGFLIRTAIRAPKLAIAVVLLVLAALASTMTYTGFLVVGVLADHLGTSRAVAGLLLGALFVRFPWVSKGKLRVVGLLPKPARRPLVVGILALCLLNFLWRGEYVPALFTGFATAFLLTYPWLRRAIFGRMSSSFFKFTGRNSPQSTDGTVIEGEFREKKD